MHTALHRAVPILRSNELLAPLQGLHSVFQATCRFGLMKKAFSACFYCFAKHMLGFINSKHENSGLRFVLHNLARGFQTIEFGHFNIKDRKIWF